MCVCVETGVHVVSDEGCETEMGKCLCVCLSVYGEEERGVCLCVCVEMAICVCVHM